MDPDDDFALGWLELQQAAATLKAEMGRRLERSAGMSMSEYDVLWYLSNDVERRMSMSELAARLVLSPSGTTRLVDRLVRRGWATRETAADNRRVVYAVLTREGARATRRGFKIVGAGRRELFDDRLDAADVADLRRVLGKLLHRLDLVSVESGP